MSSVQPIVGDEARWERIVQLTGGAADVCRTCGDCTVTCRWGLFEAEGPDMWALLSNAQRGPDADPSMESALWCCATCGSCETICPQGVHTTDVIIGLRSLAYAEGRTPPVLKEVLDSLQVERNPDGFPASLQRHWSKELEATEVGSGGGCLVYFGSATSFSDRLQRIGRAFASVLSSADVGFAVFDEEPNSGAITRLLGAHDYLERLVADNIEMLHRTGIREIVATSPYDYDVFRRIYPLYGDKFRVFHATEYLDQLIQYDRLRFELDPAEPKRIAYHDPCYLGRHHGLYGAPRRVLDEMKGLEVLEFAETRDGSPCCGGGGARPWLEDDPGEGFAEKRVVEAIELGADAIVTPCPYCIQMFEEAINKLDAPGIEVRDVVELAACWWPYAPEEEDLTFGTYSTA
jgi:Fe-S oxidoreductase